MNLETKLLEPFSVFAENLKTTNKNLYKNGQSLIESLEITKSELLEKQQIYYFRAQEAENFINNNLSTLNLPSSPERGSHTSYPSYEAINKQASVEKAAEEYKNMITIMNEKCKIHSSQFYGIFENFDLNEESRFQFIKFNVSQILDSFKETYNNILDTTKNLNTSNFESKVKQIENNIAKTKFGLASDVRVQLSGKQPMSEEQKKHEFLSFETWKELYGNQKKQNIDRSFQYSENPHLSEARQNLDVLIHTLIEIEQLNVSPSKKKPELRTQNSYDIDFADIKEDSIRGYFALPLLRKYFLQKISREVNLSKDYPISIRNWTKIKSVASSLVSSLTIEELNDHEHVFLLLNLLTKFYKSDLKMNERKYLGACLPNKVKWGEIINWDNTAYYLLQRKKLEEYRRLSNQNSHRNLLSANRERDNQETRRRTASTTSRDILIPMQNSLDIDEDSLKLTVVDEINIYLLHLELDQAVCSKILLFVAKKLEVDHDSFKRLRNIFQKKKDRDTLKKLNNQRLARIRKFNKYGKIYGLVLSLEFLGENDKLFDLTLVCRKWKKLLQKKIIKKMLAVPDQSMNLPKRLSLWKRAIEYDKFYLNYLEIKERFEADMKTKRPIDEIITLDVHRSFYNNSDINKNELNSLLKLYSHYDKRVSYCQGMNYVMGFFNSIFRDEETTFKFFVMVINKNMRGLFENDLKSLQVFFYQFDRLIDIFLPKLSDHFKKEGIATSLFSASWFITIFSTTYQVSSYSHLLMHIWDMYLTEGWKGFFKACIYILSLHEEHFLNSKFDYIVGFLNDITSTDLFANVLYKKRSDLKNISKASFLQDNKPKEELSIKDFVKKANKIPLNNQLLKSLLEEYYDKDNHQKKFK